MSSANSPFSGSSWARWRTRFENLVIGACGIAADAKSSDACLALVQRHAAAERDLPSAELSIGARRILRRLQAVGAERIRLSDAPKRVPRLRQRIQTSGRQW